MADREELEALRRLAELEAKAGNKPDAANRYLDAAMGGFRSGIGPIGGMAWEGMKHLDEVSREYGTKAGQYVTDKAMDFGASPEGAAAAGATTNAGVVGLPMVLTGGQIGSVLNPAVRRGGEAVMRWAMRPNSSLGPERARTAVRSALDHGASATEGGANRLQQQINALRGDRDSLIANAPPGLGVPVTDVAAGAQDVARRIARGTNPQDDLNAVYGAVNDFMRNPNWAGRRTIPLADAQAAKAENYRQLGDPAYAFGRRPQAERDAIVGMTSQLRGGIERAVPGVREMNQELRGMIDALRSIRPQVEGGANQAISGFTPYIAASNPAMAAAAEGMRNNAVRSAIAQALYSGRLPQKLGYAAGGSVTELPSEIEK